MFTESNISVIETYIIGNRIFKTANILLSQIKIQIFIKGNLILFDNFLNKKYHHIIILLLL